MTQTGGFGLALPTHRSLCDEGGVLLGQGDTFFEIDIMGEEGLVIEPGTMFVISDGIEADCGDTGHCNVERMAVDSGSTFAVEDKGAGETAHGCELDAARGCGAEQTKCSIAVPNPDSKATGNGQQGPDATLAAANGPPTTDEPRFKDVPSMCNDGSTDAEFCTTTVGLVEKCGTLFQGAVNVSLTCPVLCNCDSKTSGDDGGGDAGSSAGIIVGAILGVLLIGIAVTLAVLRQKEPTNSDDKAERGRLATIPMTGNPMLPRAAGLKIDNPSYSPNAHGGGGDGSTGADPTYGTPYEPASTGTAQATYATPYEPAAGGEGQLRPDPNADMDAYEMPTTGGNAYEVPVSNTYEVPHGANSSASIDL